jgi:cytochrome c biogenesis protein CcdA
MTVTNSDDGNDVFCDFPTSHIQIQHWVERSCQLVEYLKEATGIGLGWAPCLHTPFSSICFFASSSKS